MQVELTPSSHSFNCYTVFLTNSYRSLVRKHKKTYQTLTRHEKTKLAETLVTQWQKQKPPGRFLEKDDTTGYWFCIGEKSARRKTSQLLREGAAKIRRELKNESNMKKERSQRPLPVLVPVPEETENIALRPLCKNNQAVTPASRAPSTEKALMSPIQSHNNSRGRRSCGNSNQSNESTPLKQITPAEANRAPTPLSAPYPYYRYPQPQHPWHHFSPSSYYSPVSVAATNRPVFAFGGASRPPPPRAPVTVKTPVTKREEVSASANQITPENDFNKPSSDLWTSALTSSPDTYCTESPLELELSTFQASWDFEGDILENCEDISSLVKDIEKEEVSAIRMVDDLTEEGSIRPGVTETSQKTPFRPSPPRARLFRQLSPPQLSPARKTSGPAVTQDDQHLFESTWGLYSFNSVDSLEEACQDSFDLDGMVSPESHSIDEDGSDSGLPSAVDILNDLDRELEEEFLQPLTAP